MRQWNGIYSKYSNFKVSAVMSGMSSSLSWYQFAGQGIQLLTTSSLFRYHIVYLIHAYVLSIINRFPKVWLSTFITRSFVLNHTVFLTV